MFFLLANPNVLNNIVWMSKRCIDSTKSYVLALDITKNKSKEEEN